MHSLAGTGAQRCSRQEGQVADGSGTHCRHTTVVRCESQCCNTCVLLLLLLASALLKAALVTVASLRVRVTMAGWKCKLCEERTHRRPPNNICGGCRSSKRGRNNQKPRVRFGRKKQMTSNGRPQCQTPPVKKKKSPGDASEVQSATPLSEQREETTIESGAAERGQSDGFTSAVKLPTTAGQGESDSDEFTSFEYLLETTYLPKLRSLVGSWRSFIIMGETFRLLERMKKAGQKLPRLHVPAAMLSVATACTGIAEADDIRVSISKHLRLSGTMSEYKSAQCFYLMALPCASDVSVS